jgi:hypothetical protein
LKTSNLIGSSIASIDWRTRFGTIVVGIKRRASRSDGRLSDVVLKDGDVLILDTSELPPLIWQQLGNGAAGCRLLLALQPARTRPIRPTRAVRASYVSTRSSMKLPSSLPCPPPTTTAVPTFTQDNEDFVANFAKVNFIKDGTAKDYVIAIKVGCMCQAAHCVVGA